MEGHRFSGWLPLRDEPGAAARSFYDLCDDLADDLGLLPLRRIPTFGTRWSLDWTATAVSGVAPYATNPEDAQHLWEISRRMLARNLKEERSLRGT